MNLIARPERGIPGADLYANIGAMRERVTIQTVTRSKDADGFASDVADNQFVQISAEVTPEAGEETFVAGGQRGATTYLVRIRYRPDILAKGLVTWNGVTLQILQAPLADAKRRFLWLRCGATEA